MKEKHVVFGAEQLLKKNMGIEIKDSLEIFTEGNQIILKKYAPGCVFCGDARELVMFASKLICQSCVRKIACRALPATETSSTS